MDNLNKQLLLARESINKNNTLDAITIYNNILQDNPSNIESLNNLSVLLINRLQTSKAISLLKNGIIRNPKQDILYNLLGIIYFQTAWDQKAKHSLLLAIEFNDNLSLYFFNLGNVFSSLSRSNSHYLLKAIKAYRRSIFLDSTTPEPFVNLANLLSTINKNIISISLLKSAIIKSPESSDQYFLIGELYKKIRYEEKSIKAFSLYTQYKPLVYKAITKISFNSPVDNLKESSSINLPETAKLIPSYTSLNNNKFKHIIYSHIPKAGGTLFEDPIFECVKTWISNFNYTNNNSNYSKSFNYLISHGDGSDIYYKFFLDSIQKLGLRNIDYTLIRTYLVNNQELYNIYNSKFSIRPCRISSYRDPLARLQSGIDHLLRSNGNDPNLCYQMINTRHPFLDNCIYRTLYSKFYNRLQPEISRPSIDYLIDVNSESDLILLQSLILSSFQLPNIVTNKYIHKAPKSFTDNSGLIDEITSYAVKRGLIAYDLSDRVSALVSKNLQFDLFTNSSKTLASKKLHPLTLILSTYNGNFYHKRSLLIPTEKLFLKSGVELLNSIF